MDDIGKFISSYSNEFDIAEYSASLEMNKLKDSFVFALATMLSTFFKRENSETIHYRKLTIQKLIGFQ
jgi:hypothetical protein